MADLLYVETPRTSTGPSLSGGELFAAGTLLLLFVGAAASVLRLSARVSREIPAERPLG